MCRLHGCDDSRERIQFSKTRVLVYYRNELGGKEVWVCFQVAEVRKVPAHSRKFHEMTLEALEAMEAL